MDPGFSSLWFSCYISAYDSTFFMCTLSKVRKGILGVFFSSDKYQQVHLIPSKTRNTGNSFLNNPCNKEDSRVFSFNMWRYFQTLSFHFFFFKYSVMFPIHYLDHQNKKKTWEPFFFQTSISLFNITITYSESDFQKMVGSTNILFHIYRSNNKQ